jgi:hypothetical protein
MDTALVAGEAQKAKGEHWSLQSSSENRRLFLPFLFYRLVPFALLFSPLSFVLPSISSSLFSRRVSYRRVLYRILGFLCDFLPVSLPFLFFALSQCFLPFTPSYPGFWWPLVFLFFVLLRSLQGPPCVCFFFSLSPLLESFSLA